MNWSLSKLYDGFETPKWQTDFMRFETLIEQINVFSAQFAGKHTDTQAAALTQEFLELFAESHVLAEGLIGYCQLILSVNVSDETAANRLDVLENLATELTKPATLMQKYIARIDNFEQIINSSQFLSAHRFYLQELRDMSQYLLSDAEEVIISKMEVTGSSAWEKLRDNITATLSVDIIINQKEQKQPLSVIRNYAYSADPVLRKNAYIAELASYEKIHDTAAFCMNSIKGEVLTVCKMRGYESPLSMTLLNSRMDAETHLALIGAIKHNLPVIHRFLKHKAKLLGHKNSLPFHDLFAPLGSSKKYTYDEAKTIVYESFADFSHTLANVAKRAFDEKWIDPYPAHGKTGGAFCASFNGIGESRILMNFGGSFSDCLTLAHELGHAHHHACTKGLSVLNCDYPMPIAETASTFSETLVLSQVLKTDDPSLLLFALNQDLTDAAQIIADIYSRYIFELNVFKERKNGIISPTRLNELMLDAQKEAYGDALDKNHLHPFAWIPKSHYYYAHYNFYNFPYAYGMLFAKGLFAAYQNESSEFSASSFAQAYDDLLSITGRATLYEIGEKAGINVRDEMFWENSLKLIENETERFEKL